MKAKISMDFTMTVIIQIIMLVLQLLGITHLPLIILWFPSIVIILSIIALLVIFVINHRR